MEIKTLKEESHHQQVELCKTRSAYRQGRKLTAVKSYTINNESQHLFFYGVPQVNLRSELKSLCRKYGNVLSIHLVTEYKIEMFTECYHVQYDRIQSARIAKRLLDNKSFYGSVLHVCYVPEYENVTETRMKLMQRCKDVLLRVGYGPNLQKAPKNLKRKREEDYDKHEDIVTEPVHQNFEAQPLDIIKEAPHKEEEVTIKPKDCKSDLMSASKRTLVPVAVLKAFLEKSNKKRIVFRNKDYVK